MCIPSFQKFDEKEFKPRPVNPKSKGTHSSSHTSSHTSPWLNTKEGARYSRAARNGVLANAATVPYAETSGHHGHHGGGGDGGGYGGGDGGGGGGGGS